MGTKISARFLELGERRECPSIILYNLEDSDDISSWYVPTSSTHPEVRGAASKVREERSDNTLRREDLKERAALIQLEPGTRYDERRLGENVARGNIVGGLGDIVGGRGDIVGGRGDIVQGLGDIVQGLGDIVQGLGDIMRERADEPEDRGEKS